MDVKADLSDVVFGHDLLWEVVAGVGDDGDGHRRQLLQSWHRYLTVTTVPQTLLDYASQMPFDDVRYILAEADYQRLIDLDAVRAVAGRGRAGAAKLRKALATHWPDLARTDSPAEREFLFL